MVLARNIVEAIIRNSPCGKKRCLYELEKRQFDRDLAKTVVEEVYSEYDERELAHAAAYSMHETRPNGPTEIRNAWPGGYMAVDLLIQPYSL